MLARHLCVPRVSFWCLELRVFFFDRLVVRALGSMEKGRSKTSLLLLSLFTLKFEARSKVERCLNRDSLNCLPKFCE